MRAKTSESTVAKERAAGLEGINSKERTVPNESTMINECAVIRDSNGAHERKYQADRKD
jgi:hypothetical protein